MDFTISNVSDLQRALQSSIPKQEPTNQQPDIDTTSSEDHSKHALPIRLTSKDRMKTDQLSSAKQLYNLAGLQTTTNTKLDTLTDSINHLINTIQIANKETARQTELLETIARNTALSGYHTPTVAEKSNRGISSTSSVKDFGFNNGVSVISELIFRLLKQAEMKIESNGRRYRSTRVLKSNMIHNAVDITCKAQFRKTSDIEDVSNIVIPTNKDETMIQLATKLGSIDGMTPVLSDVALRELFTNSQFRVISTIFQSIMERLKVIRIVLPFYEADIINSLIFPYFNKEGELMCDWNKLQPRSETTEEAVIATTAITVRNNIGRMLARGVSVKSAINACIKEK